MHDLTRALRALLVAAVVVVAPAACQSTSPTLAGRTFLSVAVSEDGAPKALVAGTRIRLDFKDGSLSANAGCNQMGGQLRIENGRMIVTEMLSTAMGCDAGRANQDTWLMRLLGVGPGIRLVGDELTIDSGNVVVRLLDRRIVEPDLAIAGPTWTVDSIYLGETVSSVPQGAVATLVFHADGTIDVDTSCNRGSGRWVAVGPGIQVTGVALTKKACAGPGADLERAVMETLRAETIAASIEANRLTLRTGNGSGIGLLGR